MDPTPTCGICEEEEQEEALINSRTENRKSVILLWRVLYSTCDWRKGCHMISYPEMAQPNPAQKTPRRHWY